MCVTLLPHTSWYLHFSFILHYALVPRCATGPMLGTSAFLSSDLSWLEHRALISATHLANVCQVVILVWWSWSSWVSQELGPGTAPPCWVLLTWHKNCKVTRMWSNNLIWVLFILCYINSQCDFTPVFFFFFNPVQNKNQSHSWTRCTLHRVHNLLLLDSFHLNLKKAGK